MLPAVAHGLQGARAAPKVDATQLAICDADALPPVSSPAKKTRGRGRAGERKALAEASPEVKAKIKRQAEPLVVAQQANKALKTKAKAAGKGGKTEWSKNAKNTWPKGAKPEGGRGKGKSKCWNYQNGSCQWGDQCGFSHE